MKGPIFLDATDERHMPTAPPVTETPSLDVPDNRIDNGEPMSQDRLTSEARLARLESDYRQFLLENQNRPAEWWDDAKMKIRNQLAELRVEFDRLRDQAPDAWIELRSGITLALQDLEEGYRHAVREFQVDERERF